MFGIYLQLLKSICTICPTGNLNLNDALSLSSRHTLFSTSYCLGNNVTNPVATERTYAFIVLALHFLDLVKILMMS